MRILIGCEKSGVIRRAFRALGHEAYSCDILPADDGGEHIQTDVLAVLGEGWDLGILHPVCTRLANSGVLRLYIGGKKKNGFNPEKVEEMHKAAEFFKACLNAPIPKLAVENPVQHCHAKRLIGVVQTQTIQPWEYGDPEAKRTCLWLKGLPNLKPTNILPIPECGHWNNQTKSGQNKLSPGPQRAAIRSKTYDGIAKAMADQWGRSLI